MKENIIFMLYDYYIKIIFLLPSILECYGAVGGLAWYRVADQACIHRLVHANAGRDGIADICEDEKMKLKSIAFSMKFFLFLLTLKKSLQWSDFNKLF